MVVESAVIESLENDRELSSSRKSDSRFFVPLGRSRGLPYRPGSNCVCFGGLQYRTA